jgi:HPt (histidine-containing phosphotransfer) domain-containing protein
MTRTLTRTNLNSSKLTRTLATIGVLTPIAETNEIAEKLSQWISFTDAISLSAVLKAIPLERAAQTQSSGSTSLGQEFARMRSALESSITQNGASISGRTPIERPTPQSGASNEEACAYAPYRRYHQAHQRNMELKVRSVRAKVRDMVAKASPKLQQLVMLDASFEQVLSENEARLLSMVPLLLEKRFKQLLENHQQSLADLQKTDQVDLWMEPGGWLGRFCTELQAVLLAELDLRLQTSVGLIETFNREITKQV